jgi:hypothetical protein
MVFYKSKDGATLDLEGAQVIASVRLCWRVKSCGKLHSSVPHIYLTPYMHQEGEQSSFLHHGKAWHGIG